MADVTGRAKSYDAIKDTLDMIYAKVVFDDKKVSYYKKIDGKVSKEPLVRDYKDRHTVRIVYGRLKGGDEIYLLRLMRTIEDLQLDALIRKLERDKQT